VRRAERRRGGRAGFPRQRRLHLIPVFPRDAQLSVGPSAAEKAIVSPLGGARKEVLQSWGARFLALFAFVVGVIRLHVFVAAEGAVLRPLALPRCD
jgi:hypothetical protein